MVWCDMYGAERQAMPWFPFFALFSSLTFRPFVILVRVVSGPNHSSWQPALLEIAHSDLCGSNKGSKYDASPGWKGVPFFFGFSPKHALKWGTWGSWRCVKVSGSLSRDFTTSHPSHLLFISKVTPKWSFSIPAYEGLVSRAARVLGWTMPP